MTQYKHQNNNFNSNNIINNLINKKINMTMFKEFTHEGLLNTKLYFIAGGTDNSEDTGGSSSNFQRYIGIAPFNFVAINPTLEEIKTFIPNYQGKEPDYKVESDGIKGIRLSFWWKIVKDHSSTEEILKNTEEDLYFNTSILLMNNERVSTSGSIQIINNYGDTAWISPELAAKGELPLWAMKNEYQLPYRPCLSNEDTLMDVIKKYLGIPMTKNYINGAWVLKSEEELQSCRALLTPQNLAAIFNGDVSSIKQAMMSKKDNKVKFPMAVRIADDNKKYQEVMIRYPITFRTGKYDRVLKDIQAAVNNGAFGNLDFGGDISSPDYSFDFRLYVEKPTDIKTEDASSGLPWD